MRYAKTIGAITLSIQLKDFWNRNVSKLVHRACRNGSAFTSSFPRQYLGHSARLDQL